jgi:hypothetical protein
MIKIYVYMAQCKKKGLEYEKAKKEPIRHSTDTKKALIEEKPGFVEKMP